MTESVNPESRDLAPCKLESPIVRFHERQWPASHAGTNTKPSAQVPVECQTTLFPLFLDQASTPPSA